MANFALNYSFSRNLPIPLDEDAVKTTLAEVEDYVKTKGKCYEGQLFSVTGETGENVAKNGLYITLSKGENGQVIKLASQEALDAVAASAGKIDKITLNGTELLINDKVVNIDLSDYVTSTSLEETLEDYATQSFVTDKIVSALTNGTVDITGYAKEEDVAKDIKDAKDAVYASAATYADSLASNYDVAGAAAEALNDAKDYTDEEVSKVSTTINNFIGEDAGKTARAVAAEEVAKVVASADTDFDTLKEIADWIKNDTTGAANMANDIAALKEADTAIDGRLDVLEGVKHSHTNKEVLDGITAEQVTAWDDANTKKHTHENKSVLDGITAEKVANWDAAEQNAKNYADGQVAEAILTANTAAATAEQNAKNYADSLASNYDASGAASNALTEAKSYAESLHTTATAYTDTEVAKAKTSVNSYTDTEVSKAKTYAEEKVATALTDAKTYADGLAGNYDKKGAADEALASAKLYADGLKTEAIASAKTYVDDQLGVVKSEIEETIESVSSATNTLVSELNGTVESYLSEAKAHAESVAKNARETAEKNSSAYTDAEIAKLSEVYDAKGTAASALTEAKNYVDDKLVNYATQSFVTDKIVSALTNGTVDITGYAKEENVATAITAAKVEVYASAVTYADGVAATAELNAKDYADGKFQVAGNYEVAGAAAQALTDAKGYTDDQVAEAILSANTAAAIAEQNAKDYVDSIVNDKEVEGAIVKGLNSRIADLEAIDHDKLVASAVTAIVANAPEAYDTLKEIADYIANDITSAASIVNKLADLEAADEAIEERLDSLEAISGQSHTHENKSVLDGITADKVTAWDAAEQNAKNYADGLASNYDAAGSAAAVAEDLAKEVTARETADAGLQSAINTVAGDLATEVSALTDAIATAKSEAISAAASDATTKANAALESAKTYADGLVENIKPYEGGVATSIAMGENETYVVDVKVAADTDAKKNFLDVNATNELEVTGVTLDAAKTSKDITVEGGAWADAVKAIFGGTVPAGTTWESFLEKMLCVEKYAGTISTSSSFTVSLSSTLNPGFDKSGTVEVGTKATLSKVVPLSTSASQSLTAKTFTYGYKLGEDGEYKSATAYTETLTPKLKTSNTQLKVTFSNVKDAVNSGSVLETITATTEIAAKTMYVMEGENTVTVYQSGDTYTSSSAVTAGTIYVATNLKNYYKSDEVTPNTYEPKFDSVDKMATGSKKYTVTGATKYFIGDIVAKNENGYWDTDRSDVVRGLATTGWTNVTSITIAHTFKVGTKQQAVVVPAKFTSVTGKDANQGDVAFNHVKTFDFTNAQGYISSYKVFVAPADDGLGSDSKITITIK